MTQRSAQEGRPALSRDAIVETATALIEKDGLAAFTMRSLGRELGVSAMAVYGYFESRSDVLTAVLERFMTTMDTDPVPGEYWDDTLRRIMTSIYTEELAHPELASIEVAPGTGNEGLARHTERIAALHLDQGMPVPVLKRAWAMVDAFLAGFTDNAIKERAIANLPGGAHAPSLDHRSALWEEIVMDAHSDEAFACGIEIIIEGIRALAAPDPCDWRTPR